MAIFWYLVAINLLLRTMLTLFYNSYTALGFELCPDYQGRARLQSTRVVFNMVANLAGAALAWSLFFEDQNGNRGTIVAANYPEIGTGFAAATAICVVLVVAGTFYQREDTRDTPRPTLGSGSRLSLHAMQRLLLDPNLRRVVAFALVTCLSTVWVSSLQMFVYDDFMGFSAKEKTFAHSSTMVGVVLGSLAAVPLTNCLDKKGSVLLGGLVSLGANGLMALLFLTGWVSSGMTWSVGGMNLPLALGLLWCCTRVTGWEQALHCPWPRLWRGCFRGELPPDRRETGRQLLCYFQSAHTRCVCTWTDDVRVVSACRRLSGLAGPAEVNPDSSAIWRLGFVTFGAGAVASVLGMLAIQRYPLTRKTLEAMHAARRAG